ncbi:peptide ligase PGM1-related protein [Nonomuraea sp. NPDC004297]
MQAIERFDRMLSDHPRLRLRIACPSQEFSAAEMGMGTGRWWSNVRGLWETLSLAADDDLALVMFQAPRVPAAVMEYLFELISEGSRSRAGMRRRHLLVNVGDARELHLSAKLLAIPELVTSLGALVHRARLRGQAIDGLSTYSSSASVDRLAERLGLETRETPVHTLRWGTKAGSRRLFRLAGVPHPPGSYQAAHDVESLAGALAGLCAVHGPGRWLVKIDSGFGSGHGNALVELDSASVLEAADALRHRLRPLSDAWSRAAFLTAAISRGAVVEKLLEPADRRPVRWPATAAFIEVGPDGNRRTTILGTHDQVIGSAQDFIAFSSPAAPAYRAEIVRQTHRVLDELRVRGVRGHIGVDFIARPTGQASTRWHVDALEVNLRQTGSVHPHRSVRALVPGHWDKDGLLSSPAGDEVAYRGTDSIISSSYRGISPATLVRALRGSKLAYGRDRSRGVLPHLWTTLEPFGKIGATVIGRTPQDCEQLQRDFEQLLDRLGHAERSRISAAPPSTQEGRSANYG